MECEWAMFHYYELLSTKEPSWWTPEVEEVFPVWSAEGLLKQQAGTVTEAKTQLWEEFRKAT